MAPKKRTGVQNVDIGGAYKLEREASVQAVHEVADQPEAAEEDIDAELEALAQAQAEDEEETSANGTSETAAEGVQAATITDNQTHDQMIDEEEDVDAELQALAEDEDIDAELQALAEDIGQGCADNEDTGMNDPDTAQAAGNKGGETAALNEDDADMTDAEEEAAAPDAVSGSQADVATDGDAVLQVQESAAKGKQASSGNAADAPAEVPTLSNTAGRPNSNDNPDALPTAKAVSQGASDAAAAEKIMKGSVDAGRPTFKSKKRQLAPVAQAAPVPAATPQTSAAPVNAKPTTGSRAGAVMKAVPPAANKATGKFKGPAPARAEPTNAGGMAAPAAVKPTVGKKLLAPVAKANPGNATSAASTPVKPPSVAPAKKATALVTEKAPAGDGPSPKGTGKGKTSEAEKAPKAPRAKNAYMFFMADKRDAVKAETPGISIGDTAKVIGEMWRGLSEEHKKPYQVMADADKERVAKVKADLPPMPKQPKAAKGATADKVPRAKSAYLLFCDAKREEIKTAKPGAGFGEMGKLLAAAWKECLSEDKAKYQEQSQSAKMELQANTAAATLAAVKKQKTVQPVKLTKAHVMSTVSAASDQTDGEEEMGTEAAAEDGALATLSAAADRETDAGEAAGAEAEEAVDIAVAAATSPVQEEDKESDDEADRENADWDANPAEFIIGHTYHNKYMVKRKGLDFTEYGLVDARAAKRQRLTGDNNDPKMAVSLEMLEDYDSFCKDFRRCVHENQDQGNLDLDNIGQGSALEMCYYLGKLQEEHYLLSKPPKRKGEVDVMIKVPMLGISMVVQRLVNVERKLRMQAEALAAEKAEEVERLKGELTVLQMMATAAQGKQKAVAMEE